MSYKQLTLEQRYEIRAYMQAGFINPDIANRLGVHKTTIYRELKRNSGQRGYRPNQAQLKTEVRRKTANKNIRFSESVKYQVEALLRLDLSPEQVSGYLYREHSIKISHERIYQHIWANKHSGGDLHKHLRCSNKKKRKRYGSRDRRGLIPDRLSIDQRPDIVDTKERIGDWEIDTIIGKNHKGALLTAVERKTKFTVVEYVPNRKAHLITKTLIRMLHPYSNRVLTITSDNGKEFAYHKKISQNLLATVYFAHPYHAWERGLNENTNGLIRQYFPKKSSFEQTKKEFVLHVQNKLNNRPRKALDFKTPIQCFLDIKVALIS